MLRKKPSWWCWRLLPHHHNHHLNLFLFLMVLLAPSPPSPTFPPPPHFNLILLRWRCCCLRPHCHIYLFLIFLRPPRPPRPSFPCTFTVREWRLASRKEEAIIWTLHLKSWSKEFVFSVKTRTQVSPMLRYGFTKASPRIRQSNVVPCFSLIFIRPTPKNVG